MVQKEFAEKLVSKNNNFFSLYCKIFSNFSVKFYINKNCFFPKPKIDSAILHFKKTSNYLSKINNLKEFLSFLKIFFKFKRKTLINNIKYENSINLKLIKKYLSEKEINLKIRASELSLDEFINLYKYLYQSPRIF